MIRGTGIHFALLAYGPEDIFLLCCMFISHCIATVVYIKTSHYCIYKFKNKKLQLLVTTLLANMCWQQISPLNATYMSCGQITQCAFMGEVCKYLVNI